WGMGVDLPTSVTCGGGKYAMPTDDDQETPDTYIATFDFGGGKGATWEGHSCHPRGFENVGFGVNFYGSKGHLIFAGNEYKFTDLNGKILSEGKGRGNDAVHFEDFFNGIRVGKTPRAEIEDAQKSTMLCHLGNIAYRTGSVIRFDPKKQQIIGNQRAMAYWGRKYRRGWEPKV
ncbi:MAG: gfo/Idh/MocA family oxidoreductase, partial [Limisphaerales bacterium]